MVKFKIKGKKVYKPTKGDYFRVDDRQDYKIIDLVYGYIIYRYEHDGNYNETFHGTITYDLYMKQVKNGRFKVISESEVRCEELKLVKVKEDV